MLCKVKGELTWFLFQHVKQVRGKVIDNRGGLLSRRRVAGCWLVSNFSFSFLLGEIKWTNSIAARLVSTFGLM
jgi:hypothetical protein